MSKNLVINEYNDLSPKYDQIYKAKKTKLYENNSSGYIKYGLSLNTGDTSQLHLISTSNDTKKDKTKDKFLLSSSRLDTARISTKNKEKPVFGTLTKLSVKKKDKEGILKKFKSMRHLDSCDINQIFQQNEYCGFTKENPPKLYDKKRKFACSCDNHRTIKSKIYEPKSIYERKSSLLPGNKIACPLLRTHIKILSPTNRKSVSSSNVIEQNSLENIRMIKSNVNKSKIKLMIENLMSGKPIMNNSNSKSISGLKQYSLVDKLLLKYIDPDEQIQDYVSPNSPFDKYTRFKNRCIKKRFKMDKLLASVYLYQILDQREVTLGVARARVKEKMDELRKKR